jgi:hypothetical protein
MLQTPSKNKSEAQSADMSTFLKSTLMTAELFNDIPAMSTPLQIDDEILNEAGRIFIRHSMNRDYAPAYIHRHFEMPDDSIIFHDSRSPGVDIATITPTSAVPTAKLNGTSFLLRDDGCFQAFEYALVDGPTFTDEFLNDYATFLEANGLQTILGLVAISRPAVPTTEFTFDEKRLSISVPTDEVEDYLGATPIPTSWVFDGGVKTDVDVLTACIICHKSVYSVCLTCHAIKAAEAGYEGMVERILMRRGLVMCSSD